MLLRSLTPLPCIPNREHVKHKSDDNQKFVISGRVSRQSNEIEKEKENGYDDDPDQFMRTMNHWLDRIETADTSQEDKLQIAGLLKQWYDLNRTGQWTKPNQKNKDKIRRIKVILGE